MIEKLRTGLLFGAVALVGRELLAHIQEDDLDGQVVLITGSSRGLGFILAQQFARHGCKVVICARGANDLRRAETMLKQQGADVLAVVCDVSARRQVENLVNTAIAHFGQIDILVNNAGIIQVGPVETMQFSDYEQAMDTMFWGILYPTLAVLPHMRTRQYGKIVNITSIGGKAAVPHLLPYVAAKFAGTGFSEGLRAELTGTGIQVTTVIPGLMRTGSYLEAFFKGRFVEEFTWFGLTGNLPFISMDAERAARQIITVTKRGQSEVVLSIPATMLAKFHGLFPGLTSNIFGLVDSLFLPSSKGGSYTAIRGIEAQQRIDSSLFNTLTVMGRNAARKFNQVNETYLYKAQEKPDGQRQN